MKKLIGALWIGVIASFAAGPAHSVDNVTVDVLLTIQSVNVEGVSTSVSISAPVSASRISQRAIIRNPAAPGAGNEDFSIRVASQSGSWTRVETNAAVGVNEYRLRSIWAVYIATLTAASFDDDDILTGSAQISSATKFFSNTGTAADVGTPANDGGFNLPPGSERSLFFRFDSGASGTSGSLTAYVNVSATATP